VKLLLDSVILIDHFNGIVAATDYLSEVADQAAVSVITRAEVLAGFEVSPAKIAARLLNSFPTFGIDQSTADLAAALRRKHRWRLPDAFQAAIAQEQKLKLVTRNSRDFPPQRFKFVLIPYQL
jgi:predicted nucleic acid-binding protein